MSLGKTTLSCNEGSTRLRPECPWRAGRYRTVPDESVQYCDLFSFPPPLAMVFFHLSSDQWWQNTKCSWRLYDSEDYLLFSRIESPHHCFEVDFHDEEDWSISSTLDFRWANILLVQHRSKFLPNRYSSCGWAGKFTSLWFCFGLWSACKITRIWSQRKFFELHWGFLCSLLFKFVSNLFKPWEILTQEWELSLFIDIILSSTPYLPCKQQVVTSNTGPILVFPRIQPSGSDASSSLGRVYSRQATASINCENSAASFVMKYSPISTIFRNPCNPIKICINLYSCDTFSIRSPYFCNPRSLMKGIIFCSVKTKLIYRSTCAEQFNRFQVGTVVYRPFSTAFAFELTSGQWDSWHGK